MNFVLLTPIEDPTPFVKDEGRWWAQPKYDGQRIQLLFGGGERTRMISRTERAVATTLPAFPGPPARIDGELVENTVVAFDLLEWAGEDFRPRPYAERLEALARVITGTPFELVTTAKTPEDKARLFITLVETRAEGVVFRDQGVRYMPGRTWAGLKFKFVSTVTAQVLQQNAKRSVQVGLALQAGSDQRVVVGDVTIPPNREIPRVGQLVEVRYLYAVKGSDKLFQPVLLRTRDDVPVDPITALRYRGARK